MTIRSRLTFFYGSILASTLVMFALLLYYAQASGMLRFQRAALAERSHRFVELYQDQSLHKLDAQLSRAQWLGSYRQLTAPDGAPMLVETIDEMVLPLSYLGWQAASEGQPWMETLWVNGTKLMVHSEPIMKNGQLLCILQVASEMRILDLSLKYLGTGLLLGSVLAILMACTAGWTMAGLALRPIQQITQTAQTIGVERDFSRRVEHVRSDDEVGHLATTFNDMLGELESAYGQMHEALELQRRFVADVSHELRTPITTLNGNVDLLRRDPPISEQDRREVLADMASEGERLKRLVSDLLTLARNEARPHHEIAPVALPPLLEEVCRHAGTLDATRSIACHAPDDTQVLASEDALRQVLLILLDNAIHHGQGPIAVHTEASGEQVRVSVTDSGPGMAPEVVSHLFERFYRGPTGSEVPGTGLGLAIARALVETQNGTLEVDSALGIGSTFSVVLPRA